ncbi:MAG: TIGR04283 family arsenosugar biosynthesis glycosyltransferase [Gomphosphaeria aponina SAG 52.96 = DSM 107014]|uniref:4,4'-diaponeurosporenoate glycosyltransferase n=1 Tax=Gomphosphaeria aponina SAG 52.96 = DSM 107014 TaxID=1521640 RepID=A0A941JPC9_9CHRO|nr:TIGR04283 family arsenosugar biosynthesis glycosyltransferase [Gomphosphaeria aponina SAG 52.96 = DSM 107014]
MPKISIIIPVLNEAAIIQKTIIPLLDHSDIEIIVADGGSIDNTQALVKELGVKLIISPGGGRSNQMNLGARIATGEILLFLHGDTQLPSGYQGIIREILSQPQTIAGAFQLKIDGEKWSLRLVEIMVNWRSHFFSLPYGDQAIFLKTSSFEQIGGFSQLPIMEDYELIRRLQTKGKITIAPHPVLTSSRRWEKLGVFQTTLINQLIILGYFLGIPPVKLAQLYRGK